MDPVNLLAAMIIGFIFTLVLGFGVTVLAKKSADWSYDRTVRRVRHWALAEFDSQCQKMYDNKQWFPRTVENYRHDYEDLKENLSIIISWSGDLEKLKKIGLPVLLVSRQEEEGRDPYLLVGVVPADKKIDLGEGTVIGGMPDARLLDPYETNLLKKFYPEVQGEEFFSYHTIKTTREEELEENARLEEEIRLEEEDTREEMARQENAPKSKKPC